MNDAMFLPCGQLWRNRVALFKKEGSPFWWADVRVDGRRVRVSTKQKVKGAARTFEAALIQQLSTGQGIRGKAPVLRVFAEEFLRYVEKCRLEEPTKKYYRGGWRLMKDQDIAGKRIDAISTSDAAVLQISGSGSNVNMALRTLKRMLSVAEEMKLISRSPKIRLAKENQRERLVTSEEEKMILANAGPTLRDVFLLIFDTGMRPGEACGLRWENVDFIRGVILIVRGKSKQARRHLPMSSRVFSMLKERAKISSEFLFPTRGGHIKPTSVAGSFLALRRSLGISEDVVLYCARHTFATDFMDQTGDLSKTQKTLGHNKITTTTRYLHPAVADLGSIMDARNEKRHNLGHSTDTIQ